MRLILKFLNFFQIVCLVSFLNILLQFFIILNLFLFLKLADVMALLFNFSLFAFTFKRTMVFKNTFIELDSDYISLHKALFLFLGCLFNLCIQNDIPTIEKSHKIRVDKISCWRILFLFWFILQHFLFWLVLQHFLLRFFYRFHLFFFLWKNFLTPMNLFWFF